jgi:UDPglucose--hexose-1-phosphate uridylyltransferase
VKTTHAWLADGREILYFDASDDAVRILDDPRDMPPVATNAEVRYDALLDEWVAVASHRQTRTFLPQAQECPLCPSRGGRQTEIPSPDYEVVVFENRFPSFATGAPALPPRLDGDQDGDRRTDPEADVSFRRRAGWGRCEVVCFTSDHTSSFAALTPERVRLVMEAWIARTQALSALPNVMQVFPFENRGEAIGVTLHHPHGQIYGYPFVTPRTRVMLESARRYRRRTFRNLFADVLAAERAAGARIVAENEHWTAFVPAAARWPLEVHVYPRRQVPGLPALDQPERDAFGPLYLEVLRRFDGLYGRPVPYMSAWHQAPVHADHDLAYLHLELFSPQRSADRMKYLAGSEAAMGVFVNDVTPEQAAARLRQVVV